MNTHCLKALIIPWLPQLILFKQFCFLCMLCRYDFKYAVLALSSFFFWQLGPIRAPHNCFRLHIYFQTLGEFTSGSEPTSVGNWDQIGRVWRGFVWYWDSYLSTLFIVSLWYNLHDWLIPQHPSRSVSRAWTMRTR